MINCTRTQDFSSTTLCTQWDISSSSISMGAYSMTFFFGFVLAFVSMIFIIWFFKAKNI